MKSKAKKIEELKTLQQENDSQYIKISLKNDAPINKDDLISPQDIDLAVFGIVCVPHYMDSEDCSFGFSEGTT